MRREMVMRSKLTPLLAAAALAASMSYADAHQYRSGMRSVGHHYGMSYGRYGMSSTRFVPRARYGMARVRYRAAPAY